MRDAIFDPQPGDVIRLHFGDQSWTRTVTRCEYGEVRYISSITGIELAESLNSWRLIKHTNRAEVVVGRT